MTGTVLWGVNNIYTVRTDDRELECRIKGKVLPGTREFYNPLAPGDRVEVGEDEVTAGKGVIVSRLPRRNSFHRWNKKRRAPQIFAANIDLCVCITSPESPPFRPRFIDRVGIMADKEAILVLVFCNKSDQGIGPEVKHRLDVLDYAGYPYFTGSAKNGAGIRKLVKFMGGKRVLFIGQSGVGKSTIINRILPEAEQKTAAISKKYNRGKHTTVFSVLFDHDDFEIIDTPGIREIEIWGISSVELNSYFSDFAPFRGKCRYPSCIHVSEPDCMVKEAVKNGGINTDRYESYRRILSDLEYLEKSGDGSSYTGTFTVQ